MSAAPEPVQLDAWEEAARQAVMERHETRHATRLRVIREAMALTYRAKENEVGRDRAYVSGNDVRRWLERNPEWDQPGKSANWRAAVWNHRMWERHGEVQTTASGGHRCRVQCYRLRGV